MLPLSEGEKLLSGYNIVSTGDIKYITFDIFEETGLVSHAFTTRCGGVSSGQFRFLNLAAHVGDDPGAVVENRIRACRALGSGIDDMVCGEQVHGYSVHVVTDGDRGKGSRDSSGAIPGTDALITNRPGILLSSYYADCVPVMIMDPVKKVIGLVHAGWKGTMRRIAEAAVQKMSLVFGTDPGDCLAAIGPSIGSCCYEIDHPVMTAFNNSGFSPLAFTEKAGEGRWKLDLWLANQITLEEAGIKPYNIVVAKLCTACRPDLFFSYRRQSGKCGRMASLMMLKS